MIIFNGEKWVAPKYKITRTVVVYDDNPDLYLDGEVEENILSKEEEIRLKEIENATMAPEDARKYVFEGVGEIPNELKENDKILNMIPKKQISENPEMFFNMADSLIPGVRYSKGNYIKWNSNLYIVKKNHKGAPEINPDLAPEYFEKL